MDLTYFTQCDFYQALARFFDDLHIPVNYITEVPASPQTILTNTYNPNNPAHRLIEDVYILGGVDDAIFTRRGASLDLEQARAVDYEGVLIFGVTLERSGKLPSRTHMAEITRALNREFHYTPVIAVFAYDRYVSFASCERLPYKQTWREGEKAGKVTILKDVDPAQPHSGHLRILENLKIERAGKRAVTSYAALYAYWQEVFSVSLLNKRFYRELSNWYFWALQQVEFPPDAEAQRDIRNATGVIRLITRLIFVWFLKEKRLIPDALFDKPLLDSYLKYDDATGSTYYKAILQNLFFATLNTEMQKDNPKSRKFVHRQYGVQGFYRYSRFFYDPQRALDLFKDIPFLNGGLFENLDKQIGTPQETRIDCFSDRPTHEARLKVPDALFFGEESDIDLSAVYGNKKRKREQVRGVINILNSYKFTIAENTPLEEEIALDPELLGKVFENLLASYNPETQTTARKQTGSFYTPREIVDYMVDESVIAYLGNYLPQNPSTELPEGKGAAAETVETRLRDLLSPSEAPHRFSPDDVRRLIHAVDSAKILDPACGSGAFPMGILHKMVHLLSKLDPQNAEWKERQMSKVRKMVADAERIDDTRIRERLLADLQKNLDNIEDAFQNNELDYGRKLYLIENCVYGVDIQPIAVQIAKLRFFISLIVDQRVNPQKPNLGIRPLPNLETKFVAANTLIGIEKPQQMLLRNAQIDKKEEELKDVRRKHFGARTPRTKAKYREEDQRLRRELAVLLEKDGFPADVTEQLAHWNPYDQNASAGFFDPEWMFGLQDGFDIVIGNPPYVPGKNLGNKEKIYFKNNFKYLIGKFDLYLLFIEKGIDLIKQYGKVCFIVPNAFLVNENAKLIRKAIIENNYADIIRVYDEFVFEANVENLVLILGENKNLKIRIFNGKNELLLNLQYNQVLKDNCFRFQVTLNKEAQTIIDKIEETTVCLGNISEICIGIQVGGSGSSKEFKAKYISKSPDGGNYKKVLDGKEFEPYFINWKGNYILYGNWLHRKRNEKFFINPKIIIRQIGKMPIVNIDYNGYYTLNTYHSLYKW